MDFRIFTEPQQGATYDQLLAVAKRAEALGFDAFFRSDHYLAMNADGLPGPTDAWLTLAGLARETSTIRLGTLVTSATFRHPGPLAISVAQVDQMSGGRVEFGLGAGWFEAEHTAYGIPFPGLGERFDRLTEQLEIITGLWQTPVGGTFDHAGKFYTVQDSPALPKPTQERVPVIVGGMGRNRTPELAARFATEFNIPFQSLDAVAGQYARVREVCGQVGRDADDLTYSVALVLCCGRTEDELARRAAAIGREVDELRENGAAGTPDEVVAKIEAYRALGATRVYLQVLDLDDLDHLDLVAAEVVPNVGG
ncbi:LLM class F420-dependent oxidoreductase [Gordonia sp. NB41Y]|uniref:LLM class F420-dependent oxidoreductase n=1 Tax=Gordonia sp. NB41Y TaxID=875808 RepID=UPI0002BD99EF|nr:LLM class F420-dependent oxidoreductase [Gordonia sp. NB41Y]EMP12142.1 F420-dependent oxidoreductase [Gordonia sp. NB41Y]WLP89073.1 LLM class F420-dependent oxidoreductase [Gordonia sp. NB41Y]